MDAMDMLLERLGRPLWRTRDLQQWRRRTPHVLAATRDGYVRSVTDLGLSVAQRRLVARRQNADGVCVLADVDQEGAFLSHVGPLPGLPLVGQQEFVSRYFRIELVAFEDQVAIRKHFRGHWLHFVRELRALFCLGAAGCNVPRLLEYDCDRLVVVESFIRGTVLRQLLIAAGARLRNADVASAAGTGGRRSQAAVRAAEGRRVGGRVVSEPLFNQLREQVRLVHDTGFAIKDVTYGNIVIEQDSGEPFLIDFDKARSCRSLPRTVRSALFARDDAKFERLLGVPRTEQAPVHAR